jgi:hypothetical protein
MSNTQGVSKTLSRTALSALVLSAGLLASQSASAQANVSLNIGGVLAPGVYGNIAIGQPVPVHYRHHHGYPAQPVIVARPPVVYQQPQVYYQQPPVYYQQPQVVYQQAPAYYPQQQVIVRPPVVVSPNYYGPGYGYGHGRGHHHGGGHYGGHRGGHYGGRY